MINLLDFARIAPFHQTISLNKMVRRYEQIGSQPGKQSEEESPKEFCPPSSEPENFPTVESLSEEIEDLRRQIATLSKRIAALTKQKLALAHPPQQTTEEPLHPLPKYEEPRSSAETEIRSISELKEFFATLIARSSRINRIRERLEKMHSDRLTVRKLLEMFSKRIKGLTRYGEAEKEALTKEFITNLQPRIDKINDETRERITLAQALANREAEKILVGVAPLHSGSDSDLIGIPADEDLKTLRRKSRPSKKAQV